MNRLTKTLSDEDLVAGIPKRENARSKEVHSREYVLGYQSAKLAEEQRMLQQRAQELQMQEQQLMQAIQQMIPPHPGAMGPRVPPPQSAGPSPMGGGQAGPPMGF